MSTRQKRARQLVDREVSAALPNHPIRQLHFLNVLLAIRDRSTLLCINHINRDRFHEHVNGVVNLIRVVSAMRDDWHRHIGTWSTTETSHHLQVQSLVSHLFAKYPVPVFLAKFWMREKIDRDVLRLYQELGKGKSIRSFEMPIHLTKAMARHFMNAPHGLELLEAYRWAWAKGLGASNELARAILSTALSDPSEDESFWQTVVQFLVKFDVAIADATEIIEFIDSQKFQPGRRIIYWGDDEPLQPEFSMQGRTLRSLRRHMAHWQTELQPVFRPAPEPQPAVWPARSIKCLDTTIDETRWTITEILNSAELIFEGKIMKHCVGTYVNRCVKGYSSIWSLRKEVAGQMHRRATIEVSPSNKIVQAQSFQNTAPEPLEKRIIREWAEREELSQQ